MSYSWIVKILLTKNSSRNAWLVDKEVDVLGTKNSQILTKILSRKFTYKAKWHESRKFHTTDIWNYTVAMIKHHN